MVLIVVSWLGGGRKWCRPYRPRNLPVQSAARQRGLRWLRMAKARGLEDALRAICLQKVKHSATS